MQTRSSKKRPIPDDMGGSKKGKAHWTPQEEAALIQFLFDKKNETTSGTMFKDSIFQQAALHIQPLHVKGSQKSMSSCKSKWKSVCISFVRVFTVSQ